MRLHCFLIEKLTTIAALLRRQTLRACRRTANAIFKQNKFILIWQL